MLDDNRNPTGERSGAAGTRRSTRADAKQYCIRLAATGVLYFVAGLAGLSVPFTSGNISPVWPAAGLALASLLLWGLRCWPAIALAAFLVNYFSPIPLAAVAGFAIGNTLAALAGAAILRGARRFRTSFPRLRDALSLLIFPVLLCSAISATVASLVLMAVEVKPWGTAGTGWLVYYLGDALGILLAAPVMLTIGELRRLRSDPRRWEFGALLVIAGAASVLLFDSRLLFVQQHNVLVLLVFPVIPWAAIRFRVAGTALTIAIVSVIAILATARGVGPFSADLPLTNALLLQLFLATLTISGLLFSAIIAERERAETAREEIAIHERDRAEDRARKSALELQSVLDNSPALIYMKDRSGRYLFVNRCWSELFRISPADAKGRTDFELFPEVSARQFIANDQLVMAGREAMEFEEQSELPDGVHTYQSTKVALRDERGMFYGLCGISTDITERKAKEKSLRQVHRALRVLSFCNSAVVHASDEQALLDEVCRVAVGPAGYLLAWVGRAEQDEAQTLRPIACAGAAEGFLDRIRVSWGDNQYGQGSMGCAIRTGMPVVVRRMQEQPEFAIWKEALATCPFQSVLSVPLREGDAKWGALAIYAAEPDAFDSSEVELIAELGENVAHGMAALRARKERTEAMAALERSRLELEDRVRQRTAELEEAKDAAESADRLKSAFLATMSHELRTPLNSIIGFTGIVVQGLAGPLNGEQKKQLGMVQNSARHLLALINDVLDISKIEAGQLEISSEAFSIPASVQRVVGLALPLAEKKGLVLRSELSPELGGMVGDQRRTEQILLNLVGNAVKFTDRGEIRIRCERDGQWLAMAVRDTGIGIKAEDLEMIFQPFQQADTGLARKREGSGLGLSICVRLVKLLGGSIGVESVLGEGSTFTVRLPLGGNRETENPGH